MNEILLYIGSIMVIVWGSAHIFPTVSMVKGFGNISVDNKRIFVMAWLAESFAMIAFGVLVLMLTILGHYENEVSILVFRFTAIVLLFMAINTLLTGSRTPIIPIKICPVIKSISCILIWLGTV